MTPIDTGGLLPSIIQSSKSWPLARSPDTCDRPTSPMRRIVDDEVVHVAALGGQRGDQSGPARQGAA